MKTSNAAVASMLTFCLIAMGFLGSGRCIAQQPFQLPQPGAPVVGTLTTEHTDANRLVLTAGARRSVAMQPMQSSRAQYWTLAPVARNTVRIQLFEKGDFWSLAFNPQTGRIGFERSAQDTNQLWRITRSLAVPGAIRLESVAFPGYYLAGSQDARVNVEPLSSSAKQNWFFDSAPPPPAVVIPTQQMVQQSVRANAPLQSAPTEFLNSHRNELLVRIMDLRTGVPTDLTIPAGKTRDFIFERDAGATFVERYEVVDALGNVFQQQFTTQVPPITFYDVTVYEKFLQSIAIDRTGKSPNKIEDINYQPKGVGFFVIPPGESFRGGKIDVYRSAKQANNPGAVRRLDPNIFNEKSEAEDPLERALREASGR